jgi:hypothetical protein
VKTFTWSSHGRLRQLRQQLRIQRRQAPAHPRHPRLQLPVAREAALDVIDYSPGGTLGSSHLSGAVEVYYRDGAPLPHWSNKYICVCSFLSENVYYFVQIEDDPELIEFLHYALTILLAIWRSQEREEEDKLKPPVAATDEGSGDHG